MHADRVAVQGRRPDSGHLQNGKEEGKSPLPSSSPRPLTPRSMAELEVDTPGGGGLEGVVLDGVELAAELLLEVDEAIVVGQLLGHLQVALPLGAILNPGD